MTTTAVAAKFFHLTEEDKQRMLAKHYRSMGIVGPDDRSCSSNLAPYSAPVLRGTYTVKVAKQPKSARKRQHIA